MNELSPINFFPVFVEFETAIYCHVLHLFSRNNIFRNYDWSDSPPSNS